MSNLPKEVLKVGMSCPVDLDTRWEFKGYPFSVSLHLTGWSFNSGLSGQLHLGPVGLSAPIHIQMSDMIFVDLVNEDMLIRIDSPEGS